MLILTRKVNERIVIGDDIEVSVVEIRGDQVKIGIVAPRTVKVHRREVYDQILDENRAAAQGDATDLSGLVGLFPADMGDTGVDDAPSRDSVTDAPDKDPDSPNTES